MECGDGPSRQNTALLDPKMNGFRYFISSQDHGSVRIVVSITHCGCVDLGSIPRRSIFSFSFACIRSAASFLPSPIIHPDLFFILVVGGVLLLEIVINN